VHLLLSLTLQCFWQI